MFRFFTELMEPENLTIVNTTFTSITVTWKPPAISNGEVLNYRIQVVNINANSLVTLENTTETTHTVSGLTPSTRYKVIVTAVYAGAGSGPGAHKYVTTDEIDAKPLWSKPFCPRVCMCGCMCCECTIGLHVLRVYSRFACVASVQ